LLRNTRLDGKTLAQLWDICQWLSGEDLDTVGWIHFATSLLLAHHLKGRCDALQCLNVTRQEVVQMSEVTAILAEFQQSQEAVSEKPFSSEKQVASEKELAEIGKLLRAQSDKLVQLEKLSNQISKADSTIQHLERLKKSIRMQISKWEQDIPVEDVQTRAARIVAERMKKLGIDAPTLTTEKPMEKFDRKVLDSARVLLSRLEDLERQLSPLQSMADPWDWIKDTTLLGPPFLSLSIQSDHLENLLSVYEVPSCVASAYPDIAQRFNQSKTVIPNNDDEIWEELKAAAKEADERQARPLSPKPLESITPKIDKPSPKIEKPLEPTPLKISEMDEGLAWLHSPVHELVRSPSIHSVESEMESISERKRKLEKLLAPPELLSPTPVSVEPVSIKQTPIPPVDTIEKKHVMTTFAYEIDNHVIPQGVQLEFDIENDEWVYTTFQDWTGWFPKNHTQLYSDPDESVVSDELDESEVSAASEVASEVSEHRVHDFSASTILSHARVIATYLAQRLDELTVHEGDLVNIVVQEEEGWDVVELFDKGKRGVVPHSYLEPLTEQEFWAAQKTSREDPFNDANEMLKLAQKMTQTHKRSSSDFKPGSSWSLSVGPEIASRVSEQERRRQEAIFELIYTEKTYLHDLQSAVSIFLLPLEKAISRKEVDQVIGNWDDLLAINTVLLSDLQTIEANPDEPIVHVVGNVLKRHIDSLASVYEIYCSGQMMATKKLMDLLKNPSVDGILKNASSQTSGLDLSSYLLKPMQRITRYPLLVKQILHYTPTTSPDHLILQDLVTRLELILKRVNDQVKLQECNAKITKIRQLVDFDGSGDPLGEKSMTFVYEGTLFKAKSGRELKAYLFSDLLLLTDLKSDLARSRFGAKAYWIYRKPIWLRGASVGNAKGYDEDCFVVKSAEGELVLRSDAKQIWVNHIRNQLKG
jgi:hypothetical protein